MLRGVKRDQLNIGDSPTVETSISNRASLSRHLERIAQDEQGQNHDKTDRDEIDNVEFDH